MARTPKPWFRTERSEWCVHFRGQMYKLGAHPEGFPAPRQVKGKWNAPQPILQVFHALLGKPADAAPHLPSTTSNGLLVADVFEKFLEWCQKNRSPHTYEWSQNHIQSFLDSLDDKRLPVDILKPFHVQDWVDSKGDWGPNHRRGGITAIQRAFSWAEKIGHIDKSPIRHVEKPAPKRREQVLTQSEFDTLLLLVQDITFRDVLEFCWETGSRVQEVRVIEASHYKPERGRLEIPPQQAKGKKRWRIIYLTDRSEAIVRRLCADHLESQIFRNMNGNQWDAQNFNSRFVRLQHRLGRARLRKTAFVLDERHVRKLAATLKKTKIEAGRVVHKSEKELLREARKKLTNQHAKKLGTKYALTALRHSFCQRLLEAGVDHTTVAALMGHSNAVMVSTTYSHMDQAKNFLSEELKRASRGGK
jgi:site-specific recombinase XerD